MDVTQSVGQLTARLADRVTSKRAQVAKGFFTRAFATLQLQRRVALTDLVGGHAIVRDSRVESKEGYKAGISRCKDLLPTSLLPGLLAADQALVRVTRTSICQTDRRVLARQKAHGLCDGRICLGHEGGGRVLASPATLQKRKFPVGQKVVFLPHDSCGNCSQCQAGQTNLCPEMKHLGIHTPGVFSHTAIQPFRCLYPLEESFEDDLIPLIEPLACVIRGWSRVGQPRGRVGIFGAGPMGVLLALYALRRFPETEIDLIEIHPTRIRVVEEATGLSAFTQGRGNYEMTIVASSELEAYETAIEQLAGGGRVLAFSGINCRHLGSEKAQGIEAAHRQEKTLWMASSGVELIGTSGYTRNEIAEAIAELTHHAGHYQRVQNATLDGLLSKTLEMRNGAKVLCEQPAILDLLQTDATLQSSDLQLSVLKVLIRMDGTLPGGK